MYICICMYVRACVRACVRAHIHTHIRGHTYTHRETCSGGYLQYVLSTGRGFLSRTGPISLCALSSRSDDVT